jgi:hypothetical protein
MKKKNWIKRGIKNEINSCKDISFLLFVIALIGFCSILGLFGVNLRYVGIVFILIGIITFIGKYKYDLKIGEQK